MARQPTIYVDDMQLAAAVNCYVSTAKSLCGCHYFVIAAKEYLCPSKIEWMAAIMGAAYFKSIEGLYLRLLSPWLNYKGEI